jgi:hypothetical protein
MLVVGSWGFAQSLFFSNGCSYWCKVAKVVSAALSLEKWLVFFERVSLQKQMSDQYTCLLFQHLYHKLNQFLNSVIFCNVDSILDSCISQS